MNPFKYGQVVYDDDFCRQNLAKENEGFHKPCYQKEYKFINPFFKSWLIYKDF